MDLKQCEILNWMHSTQGKYYMKRDAFQRMQKDHEQFHQTAEAVVRLLGSNQKELASDSVKELEKQSKKMFESIDHLFVQVALKNE